MNIYEPSYDEIQSKLLGTVPQFDPGLIIGIQRGGLIPAVILSHLLKAPMETINYSSKIGKGDNRTQHSNRIPDFNTDEIFLVDDINDTGYTMKEVYDEYTERGYNVVTVAIHHKESSVFKPHYVCWTIPEDSPWVYYPWERKS